jgi:CheY-like chemotaxis protein
MNWTTEQRQLEQIMVVEDNDEDFAALKRVLNRATTAKLVRCLDGEEAFACLERLINEVSAASETRPTVILLDLNLPGTDGREALVRIKRDSQLRSIPIVILSTSSNPKDVAYCYDHGANGYMVKSVNFTQFEAALRTLTEYWDKAMILPRPTAGSKSV